MEASLERLAKGIISLSLGSWIGFLAFGLLCWVDQGACQSAGQYSFVLGAWAEGFGWAGVLSVSLVILQIPAVLQLWRYLSQVVNRSITWQRWAYWFTTGSAWIMVTLLSLVGIAAGFCPSIESSCASWIISGQDGTMGLILQEGYGVISRYFSATTYLLIGVWAVYYTARWMVRWLK